MARLFILTVAALVLLLVVPPKGSLAQSFSGDTSNSTTSSSTDYYPSNSNPSSYPSNSYPNSYPSNSDPNSYPSYNSQSTGSSSGYYAPTSASSSGVPSWLPTAGYYCDLNSAHLDNPANPSSSVVHTSASMNSNPVSLSVYTLPNCTFLMFDILSESTLQVTMSMPQSYDNCPAVGTQLSYSKTSSTLSVPQLNVNVGYSSTQSTNVCSYPTDPPNSNPSRNPACYCPPTPSGFASFPASKPSYSYPNSYPSYSYPSYSYPSSYPSYSYPSSYPSYSYPNSYPSYSYPSSYPSYSYPNSYPSYSYPNSYPSYSYPNSYPSSYPSYSYPSSYPSYSYPNSYPSYSYPNSYPSYSYPNSNPSSKPNSYPSYSYPNSYPSYSYPNSYPSTSYQSSFPSTDVLCGCPGGVFISFSNCTQFYEATGVCDTLRSCSIVGGVGCVGKATVFAGCAGFYGETGTCSAIHGCTLEVDGGSPTGGSSARPSSSYPNSNPSSNPNSYPPYSYPNSNPSSNPNSYPPYSYPNSNPSSNPNSYPPYSYPNSNPSSKPNSYPPYSYPNSNPSSKPNSYPSYSYPNSYPSYSYPNSYPSYSYPSSYPSYSYPNSYPSYSYPSSFPTSSYVSSLQSSFPSSFPTSSYPTRRRMETLSLVSSFPSSFPTFSYVSSLQSSFPSSFASSVPIMQSSIPNSFASSYPNSYPSYSYPSYSYPSYSYPNSYPSYSYPNSNPSSKPNSYPPYSYPNSNPSSNPNSYPQYSYPNSNPSSNPLNYPSSYGFPALPRGMFCEMPHHAGHAVEGVAFESYANDGFLVSGVGNCGAIRGHLFPQSAYAGYITMETVEFPGGEGCPPVGQSVSYTFISNVFEILDYEAKFSMEECFSPTVFYKCTGEFSAPTTSGSVSFLNCIDYFMFTGVCSADDGCGLTSRGCVPSALLPSAPAPGGSTDSDSSPIAGAPPSAVFTNCGDFYRVHEVCAASRGCSLTTKGCLLNPHATADGTAPAAPARMYVVGKFTIAGHNGVLHRLLASPTLKEQLKQDLRLDTKSLLKTVDVTITSMVEGSIIVSFSAELYPSQDTASALVSAHALTSASSVASVIPRFYTTYSSEATPAERADASFAPSVTDVSATISSDANGASRGTVFSLAATVAVAFLTTLFVV